MVKLQSILSLNMLSNTTQWLYGQGSNETGCNMLAFRSIPDIKMHAHTGIEWKPTKVEQHTLTVSYRILR